MADARNPLGYQQLSIDTTAGGVPLTVPAGSALAMITPSGAIRYRDDGTPPTIAVGFPVAANSVLVYDGKLSALLLISQFGTVTVDVTYYSK